MGMSLAAGGRSGRCRDAASAVAESDCDSFEPRPPVRVPPHVRPRSAFESRSTFKSPLQGSAFMASSSRPLAVVTGASSGIGYHLARIAAEHGHDLVTAADRAENA